MSSMSLFKVLLKQVTPRSTNLAPRPTAGCCHQASLIGRSHNPSVLKVSRQRLQSLFSKRFLTKKLQTSCSAMHDLPATALHRHSPVYSHSLDVATRYSFCAFFVQDVLIFWPGLVCWAVTFGTARRGLGGLRPRQSLIAVPNVTAHPSTASVHTSYYSMCQSIVKVSSR